METDGPITIITIDRQDVANALDISTQVALAARFDAFDADDAQRVAILTGAGPKAFCAGHDLRTPTPQSAREMPASGFGGLTARFGSAKPVIAAVNGVCVGGGFEMALACDIIVAGESARFALPEARVGMVALGGGILRLMRQIGSKRAMGMILTGRLVAAREAVAMGFVTEMVADADVLPAAMRWAHGILQTGPLASRASKQVAADLLNVPLDKAMSAQWTLPEVRRWRASDEAREGASAFVARRPPRWSEG